MGVGKSTFVFQNEAKTATISSITIDGGKTNINITRDNQSYSHVLRTAFTTIATLAVGTTDYLWTPTASQLSAFWAEVPSQKSRMIDVYLDTYNGSTLVGRDVHGITMTLSENTGKPTITGFTITDSTSAASSRNMILIGKSSLTASSTITPLYGASIARTSYVYNNVEYGTIGEAFSAIPATLTPTNYTVGVKATDTRGFATTNTLTKRVAKYVNPDIERFEVIRCDSSGTETASGTKAKVVIDGSWAHLPVSGTAKNTATLRVGYSRDYPTEGWTYKNISVTNGSINVVQIMSWTIESGYDYSFCAELKDGVSGNSGLSYKQCRFSNDKNILYISPDGNELSFDADTINIGKSGADSELNLSDMLSIRYHAINGVSLIPYDVSTEDNNDNIPFSFGRYMTTRYDPATYIGIRHLIGSGYNEGTLNIEGYDLNILGRNKISVLGQLTGGCTTHISGNCNELTATGTYYIGNSGTNKPGSGLNGWLESFYYDASYVHQRYTTYTGLKYERTMQDGTWGSWESIVNSIVASGTSDIWTYYKFASGFAICYGISNINSSQRAVTGTWGSLLEGGGISNRAYPFSFTSVLFNDANINCIGYGVASIEREGWSEGTSINTHTQNYRLIRPGGSSATLVSGTSITYLTIGTWK